jgi:hypothetical protein
MKPGTCACKSEQRQRKTAKMWMKLFKVVVCFFWQSNVLKRIRKGAELDKDEDFF